MLTSIENKNRVPSVTVPTLIPVGERNECDASLLQEMHDKIAGLTLVILQKSGHLTFVDQPSLFLSAVDEFLHPAR